MKKTLLILGSIVAILLVAFLLWSFAGRDKNISPGEAVRELLPFGEGDNLGQPTTDDKQLTTKGEDLSQIFDESGVPIADLFRISDTPVAGAVAFTRPSTSSGQVGQTVVRFVDRATGHVIETILPKGEALVPLEKKKVTNNTIPKVYEAYFRPDGNFVLLRMLENDSDRQRNLILDLTSTSSTAINLRGEMTSIAVGSGNILYYADKGSGNIVSSPFNGGAMRTILTSPFTNWRVTVSENGILVHTKASIESPGYAYTVGSGRSLNKILGPLTALSAVPNSAGTSVLYSYNNGTLQLRAKNLRTGAETEISPTTLAEKCVWSAKQPEIIFCGSPIDGVAENEPDNWYRGTSSFSDRFWKFDVNKEIAEVVAEPKSLLGVEIDTIRPQLSPSEDYLIFMNKRDMTLWAFRLN
ncbi:MAG: hypothetical protein A2758_00550 [Candidatus Zambryskibacteria bacterium RIFCSPHIGHO2_01_FULL_49_18]|uniref:Dipeptidylpeptidase IV N-terminal domain-containing protein n=2 Tax=Candidatus Zambryskiibacteriota TaxID=1817925 RepID=A0A1G2T2S8_9BACT|nr:MAG: hypothetical protein A2758_00550 [Candidatus Zambryskibacteria bacterium RIFCSPHIGHO2_01_FULL_49_18]OHB05914.1 MAG: hypothetical protein A3A26_03135 [Candidatus Zambryskibacteria bacterium RIFCSPLOWO2_01_FULL_47_14]